MTALIDRISIVFGRLASYTLLLLIVLIVGDVIFRYLFKFTEEWITELEWHLFGVTILFSGADALLHHKHVRVDVFYDRFSDRGKKIIDIISYLFLLIPWTFLVVTMSEYYAHNSWLIKEGSADPGGLCCRYLIKYCIPIGFLLLEMQGFSELLKILRKRN